MPSPERTGLAPVGSDDPPEVVVVIPAYNQAHYLGECLQSIVAQTYQNWTAIVVDDVSPDHAQIRTVVEETGDSRIRIVRHETNRGLAAARNTGYKESTADYLYCVDGDDKIDPSCLESMVAVLLSDDSLDCVFSDHMMFGSINRVLKFHVPPAGKHVLALEDTIPGSGTMLRRRMWERLGGYDESKVLRAGREDYEFNLRAFSQGCKSAYIAEPMYYYRKAETSMAEACRLQDHVVSQYIVDKNKDIFDTPAKRKRFLSRFLERAARAWYHEHSRKTAIPMAIRAWRMDPSIARLKTVARTLLPHNLHRAWRRSEVRKWIPFARYPLRGKQRYRPFFIVGASQSGSVLLGNVLNKNTQLYLPPDTGVLGGCIREFRRHRSRLAWPDILHMIIGRFEFRLQPEKPDIWLGPLVAYLMDAQSEKRNLATVLDAFYRFHAKEHGVEPVRWGDQTATNSLDDRLFEDDKPKRLGEGVPETLDRLLDVFPDAQFIHIHRHPRDVIHAQKRCGQVRTLQQASERWIHITRQVREFIRRHPQSCKELSYEDLLAKPEAVCRSLCEFLEVDYDPPMTEWEQSEDPDGALVARDAGGYFFTPEQTDELQDLLGDDLKTLGYPPCTETRVASRVEPDENTRKREHG